MAVVMALVLGGTWLDGWLTSHPDTEYFLGLCVLLVGLLALLVWLVYEATR